MKKTVVILKRAMLSIGLAMVSIAVKGQTYPVRYEAALDTLCMSKFTAVYRYTINTRDAEGELVTDSIMLAVQVGDGVWRCTPYSRYLIFAGRGKELGGDKNEYLEMEALMHVPTLVSGFPEGKITSHEAVAPFCYEVVEEREAIAWTLTKQTDSACGYVCQGAKGRFRGKTWEVMFAEDIASPAGPWKLWGLPGLITFATDAERIHTFTLVGLLNEQEPLLHETAYATFSMDSTTRQFVNTPVKYERRTLAEMLDHKRKTIGNRMYPSKPTFYWTGPRNIATVYTATGTCSLMNGTVMLDKAHEYRPLEE